MNEWKETKLGLRYLDHELLHVHILEYETFYDAKVWLKGTFLGGGEKTFDRSDPDALLKAKRWAESILIQ